MLLFITLVLSAATSFRCASRVFDIVISTFGLSLCAPSWSSGRLWLLRIGHYKLTRPKVKTDDWVWIIDHTVQSGTEKCLLILGLRLSQLPSRSLMYQDMEPIALVPMKKSNGDIVWECLEETVKKTGSPREIIADYGSDVKSGIEKFCRHHPETCYIYDIKHKTAALLKQELDKSEDWIEFRKLASKTQKQVRQTELGFATPPNQRSKARYMNIDILVDWGQRVLSFIDSQESNSESDETQEKIDEKLGWLKNYRNHIAEWKEILDVVGITENFIRNKGISRAGYRELKYIFLSEDYTVSSKKIRSKLLRFYAQEAFKAKSDERLLGSSEIIESTFGKLKCLEQDQSKSGFTGLVLSLGAIVSSTTQDVIRAAMETTPTKKILKWCKDNLGETLQSKRRRLLKTAEKTEQKPDQFEACG